MLLKSPKIWYPIRLNELGTARPNKPERTAIHGEYC